MKPIISAITFLFLFSSMFSQDLTGEQLLSKAIKYHDANGNWPTFNGNLLVTMETPDKPNRDSKIIINLPEDYFYVKAVRDTLTTEFTINKGHCSIKFCGKSEFDDTTAKTHQLTCERATMYKNYYTFLYGLPMKLKDKGTIINEKIERKSFKGKDYLVLKATYDESVGSDIWYFYFNPKTYAMEIYQFYHDEAKNDGEYILLTEEETINGIKMPKNRAWYTNKDNTLLGTDILKIE
jgi:hypothetical protein